MLRTLTFHKSKAIFILAGLLSMSCESELLPERHFVIRQGDHYASPKVAESLQSNKLEFEAVFNESAIYDLGDQSLQNNKNKLLGFSDCNAFHHENSARFAWQWFNGRLEIYAYCYINGERKEAYMGTVPLNEYNHYELEVTNGEYIFSLNHGSPISFERENKCDNGLYYRLWPYFGGSVPAPHDVFIDIRMKY